MKTKYCILATGYNCGRHVTRFLFSMQNLNPVEGTEIRVVIINDGSKDNTGYVLDRADRHFTGTLQIFHESENKGAAFRRWQYMKTFIQDPETVVILVGLDDELLPEAIERIHQEYECGKLMTYGNWVNQRGRGLPSMFPLYFDTITHDNRDYRKVQYRSTAPNSFKAKLLTGLCEDDFKIDGKWVETCTETNLMFCLLEMCGEDRIGVIQQPIYLYNEKLPNGSIGRFGAEEKRRILNRFRQREKKPLFG